MDVANSTHLLDLHGTRDQLSVLVPSSQHAVLHALRIRVDSGQIVRARACPGPVRHTFDQFVEVLELLGRIRLVLA
jgi:hypothetical protein